MFDIPIYHKSNVAQHLISSLQADIEDEHKRREYYLEDSEMGKHYRKLSGYNADGTHAAATGLDPMVNISDFPELKRIVHTHALDYLQSLTNYPFTNILEKNWNTYSWWSCFEGGDSYSWHNHSQFFLIATYYVENNEEHSPIAFRNPIGNLLEAWLPGKMTGIETEKIIKPKTGDLIIWPAWLEHMVYNKTLWELEKNNAPDQKYHRGGNFNKSVAGIDPINKEYDTIRKSITISYMKPAELFGYMIQNLEGKK